MDIEYLLFLQNFRNSIHDALTPFLEDLSLFGVTCIVLLPVFVYWCLDKRRGLFILTAWKISVTMNALVKLTACVYRPWVRDPRVIPAGDAIATAGGYSFPSGHTMMATPIYGGMATLTGKRWLRGFWIALILLTAFSRNYLGVHTPQDVVVGVTLGCVALWITAWVFRYLERRPEMEARVLLAGIVIAILTFLYINFKPYPMDYVDGKLLVDPKVMRRDSWKDVGGLLALAIAWYVEKRWVKFSATGWNVLGVTLCVVGLLPLGWMLASAKVSLVHVMGPYWGRLANQFVLFFYVMVLWPLVLKRFTGHRPSSGPDGGEAQAA